MDIQLTGVLVSKTGDFINDYQEFDIQGGQEGLNSILAEELEEDTLYWIKGIFVMNGVEYESKPAQFKTGLFGNVFRINNLAAGQNTVQLTNSDPTHANHVVLKYSTDRRHWSTWDSDDGAFSITLEEGETVYMKGDNEYFSYGPNGRGPYYYFSSTDSIGAAGNTMYLLDSTGASTTVPLYGFEGLFKNCTGLVTPPELPATTIGDGCYCYMFYGCTALETAPELPGTCGTANYRSMFEGCTSLLTAPELPSIYANAHCYNSMFAGCTSLVNAPSCLPAIYTNYYCYQSMFAGCTSLVNAPAYIAATTAGFNSCAYMFDGCTSLVTAPEIRATSMSIGSSQQGGAYYRMFRGCTSLVNAPSILPCMNLSDGCYESMFYGCSSLETAPELPATVLKADCYQNMFYGCSSLNKIIVHAESWENVYDYNHTALHLVASQWVNGVASIGDFYNMGGATIPTGVSGIPSGWTEQNPSRYLTITNTDSTTNTITLQKVGTRAPNIALDYSTDGGFTWNSWTYASGNFTIDLPVNGSVKFKGTNQSIGYNENYYWQFRSTGLFKCSGNIMSLVDQTFTATTLSSYCFSSLFSACQYMTEAPDLPDAAASYYSFGGIFKYCTRLTKTPVIPDYTSSNAYRNAFYGCSSLNEITTNVTNWDTGCFYEWVNGVAATGDFYNLGGATIPTNTSGIPSGWTEHTSI